MRVHPLCQSIFLLSVLLVFVLCFADDRTFQVVGTGYCGDCADNNFKPSQAFSGLHVTIDCKLKNGDVKRVAAGTLNDKGEFALPLPQDIVDDGHNLKHDCYAQLHSAAAIPCPTHSKIAFKSLDNKGKLYTFVPNNNLQFSAALCTSEFLWPHFKFPPLPKIHPWLKNFGHPWTLPPWPPLHKPLIPPLHKHPIVKPHPSPVYVPPPETPHPPKPTPPKTPCPPKPKPPTPPKTPCPPKPTPPKPPKKPCPPKYKPLPPPVPIYKPLPPPVPIYKPLPPPVPIYKPLPPPVPIYKPLPPPFFKKPCPPLPKLPPFPKIPPKTFFKHPKFGGWPPLPPAISQP